ncbi:MAG: putative dehydrogenase [Acidimicrobiales bacterium]|nr:putative dehydrogenase [Acidimicrobiales bacterium]
MNFRVPVEAGHILQFRRAVGQLDAALADDAVAPPTYLMAADHFAPDYERRPQAGRPWPGPVVAPAGGGGGFHAEQVFEYHRHVRAGDVLTATVRPGRTWEKAGRRGGRLEFHETVTEYRDAAGELVVTATWVSVATERIPE